MSAIRGQFLPDGQLTFCGQPELPGHGEGCNCAQAPLIPLAEVLRQEITVPLAILDLSCYVPIADAAPAPCTLDTIREAMRTGFAVRGWKQLDCALDVWAALKESLPEAEPVPPGMPNLAMLTGIDVTVRPEFGRGRYRLTIHDACDVDVDTRTVDHARCTVAAEGTLTL